MIDVHCHLNFPEFNEQRDTIIENSKDKFSYIIDSGASYDSNIRSYELSQQYPEIIKHSSYR